MKPRRTRTHLMLLALALLCAAPTPGDIGGCGSEAAELDPEGFFVNKRNVDCERCLECGLVTSTCDFACNGAAEADSFPDGCVPLVHDGLVCLRALQYASCGEYERFVDDVAPEVPTECNFCPPRN